MEFKVVNKFLQEKGKTFVAIRCQDPYTAYDRVLEGDRTTESDESLIQAVIGLVTTELNPAEGVKALNVELVKQKEQFNSDLAEKDAKIAEVKAVADWAVLARVTDTDNPLDPTLFKRGLELVELGKAGKTYQPQEIFALENPDHIEKFQEGKRVMVQVTEPFTYQGETLEQLESLHQNGKIGIWKWTEPKQEEPKPAGELETQPVQ